MAGIYRFFGETESTNCTSKRQCFYIALTFGASGAPFRAQTPWGWKGTSIRGWVGFWDFLPRQICERRQRTAGVRPTLFIHKRCGRLVETLPALQHDPNRPEDVLKVDADEDGVGGDDAADALRYLVATKSRAITQTN